MRLCSGGEGYGDRKGCGLAEAAEEEHGFGGGRGRDGVTVEAAMTRAESSDGR